MTEDFPEHVQRALDHHRILLNRLEMPIGCVTCRGPLAKGRCLRCDA